MDKPSILITGCSSGIGYDAAMTLHDRGWRVFASCRSESDCDFLRSKGLESFELDYASSKSIQSAVKHVYELTGGTLDALFNNGAFAIPGRVEDLPRDALRSIFETNLFGQFELINAVLPGMRQNNSGRIINNSSVLGMVALPYRGAYNSTKFAMEGLTDTFRLELHDTNIHISLIEPGPIGTKIRENSIPHFERWIDWQNSSAKYEYESQLMPRLYQPSQKKDRFELPCSAVTDKLIHALEHRNPKPRYYVTTPTHFIGTLKRFLTTRLLDKVLLNS
ncbi:MAG: SDR family NAD(P)-dependent oxidoreductase [Granulosicoccus sp.]